MNEWNQLAMPAVSDTRNDATQTWDCSFNKPSLAESKEHVTALEQQDVRIIQHGAQLSKTDFYTHFPVYALVIYFTLFRKRYWNFISQGMTAKIRSNSVSDVAQKLCLQRK